MEIKALYEKYLTSGKVSTDTRKISAGSVFFALQGPKFNANDFAEEALGKGAVAAVVDNVNYVKDERYILVDDTLVALQELARHHRSQLTIPVIGLTGSNGKTTSKELLAEVLGRKFKTYATQGNLNNHIGVPLTILSIGRDIEIAVVEMGANHLGEISRLCEISDPTHGFITNIGRAHVGMFGGFDNIIRAKSELYQHLLQRSGTVFINSQNPVLANMAKRFLNPIFYPAKGDYYHCELISADPYLRIQTEGNGEIDTHLVGGYNFENIAAALCLGKFFGVDASMANEAIARYVPGNMRSQVIQDGTNMIILDAYNANPSSMEAAIDNLSQMNSPRRVAILGDMYELGAEGEGEHRRLGIMLKEKGIDVVYLCGILIKPALEAYPEARYFEAREDLMKDLKENPIRDSTILIKASRGMGLEKVLDVLGVS
jgi:UDP-N-acetylmuramoyl-tripeptide--D-alanyl-D-alanine ligase